MVSLPIAVFVTFASTTLIRILGGAAYLPDSATALSIMIWSVPIGFVNSVTQYALIAVNQQRFLTRAFLIGVAFTGDRQPGAGASLRLRGRRRDPDPGGALAVHPLLLGGAALCHPHALVQPAVAAGGGCAPWMRQSCGAWTRAGIPQVLAWIAGFLVYLAMLLALGAFRGEEFDVIKARLPGLRRWRLRST